MNDEAMELLRECRQEFVGWAQGDPTGQMWTLAMITRIDALLAQSKAAPQEQTGHERDSRPNGDNKPPVTVEDSNVPASAAPDSGEGMPVEAVRYCLHDGPRPLGCHVRSDIDGAFVYSHDYDALRAYALSLREREGVGPTEEEKNKIVASLLLQLWITLPHIPAGTMPNYEQAWDIAKSVLAAAPSAGELE